MNSEQPRSIPVVPKLTLRIMEFVVPGGSVEQCVEVIKHNEVSGWLPVKNWAMSVGPYGIGEVTVSLAVRDVQVNIGNRLPDSIGYDRSC